MEYQKNVGCSVYDAPHKPNITGYAKGSLYTREPYGEAVPYNAQEEANDKTHLNEKLYAMWWVFFAGGIMKSLITDKKLIYIIFTVMIFSVSVGGAWGAYLDTSAFSPVGDYVRLFVASAETLTPPLGFAIRDNIILFAVFFVCERLYIGRFAALYFVARELFSASLLGASFARVYGAKAILSSCALNLHFVFLIPTFILFYTFSVKSFDYPFKTEKNFKIFSVFFQILMLTTFCASIITETYVNTIFAKFVVAKFLK